MSATTNLSEVLAAVRRLPSGAWFRPADLQGQCCLTPRQIRYAIKDLRRRGHLERRDQGGVLVYRLALDRERVATLVSAAMESGLVTRCPPVYLVAIQGAGR